MNARPLDRGVTLRADDRCPKCREGYLEPRRHRFGEGAQASLPDCSWLACSNCDFETEPE